MRLRELEATFVRWERRPPDARTKELNPTMEYCDYFIPVAALGEAHGIRFICPKSWATHGGRIGAHECEVFFAGSPVPPELGKNKAGQTVRWNASGTSLDDLTLTPSIQEEDSACGWHGFVTAGAAA